MTINITFAKTPRPQTTTAIIYVFASKKLGASARDLDKKSGGLIARAIKQSPKFTGKHSESLVVSLPQKSGFNQAVCLGLGKPGNLDALAAETAGGQLFPVLEKLGADKAVLYAEHNKQLKKISDYELATHIAAGIKLRSYKFHRYKSKPGKQKTLTHLTIVGESHTKAKKYFSHLDHIASGVFMARDLVNEPPNHLHPEQFAKFLKKELHPLGVKISILDEKQMQKMGMGAILAVGMGSKYPPRIVVMHWKGDGKAKTKPVALVGKGVTFDTGGISVKPAAGMGDMKMDMGGAAAVAGTMKTLALRKSKSNVVGIVGLAENMLSGDAYRPGDILTSYSGKTIEVQNTDAEGRLVLADTLTHVQKTYKPRMIIDLATLTGAMMVALGHEYCGTFVNDDKLWSQMEQASKETGEKLWRMPLDEFWKKDMESDIADLQNLGKSGRYGGACTAAGFIEHFIEDKTPWAHMDIAGTAWIKRDKPTVPKPGSGFGVRVLDRLIANHYEGK